MRYKLIIASTVDVTLIMSN